MIPRQKKIKIGDREFELGKVYDDPRLNAFGKKKTEASGSTNGDEVKIENRHTLKRD